MTPVLSVKNLSIDFLTPSGPVHALREVNLSVPQNRIVGIVGESGSGKSTVASAVMRLLANNADVRTGEIEFEGRDILAMSESELRTVRGEEIAMVFQDYALYPHMTVRQNMGFALEMRGMPKAEIAERVDTAARLLDIGKLLDRRPKALSGGQRQRVAMGRAIVRQPAAFLFDEPLSNLDAALRVEMRYEIAKLHRALKATMIYVTHDQVEAMTMADTVAVMNHGRRDDLTGAVPSAIGPRGPVTSSVMLGVHVDPPLLTDHLQTLRVDRRLGLEGVQESISGAVEYGGLTSDLRTGRRGPASVQQALADARGLFGHERPLLSIQHHQGGGERRWDVLMRPVHPVGGRHHQPLADHEH